MQPLPSPLDVVSPNRALLVREPWRQDLHEVCAAETFADEAGFGFWTFSDASCWATPASLEPFLIHLLAASIEVRLATDRASDLAARILPLLPEPPPRAPWELCGAAWAEIAAAGGPAALWPPPRHKIAVEFQARRRLSMLRDERAVMIEAGFGHQPPGKLRCSVCGQPHPRAAQECGCCVCGACLHGWREKGGAGCPTCPVKE